MNDIKALGWIVLSIVAAAVVKTVIEYVFGFLANGPGSMTFRGIAAFIVAILVSYALWTFIGRLKK